MGRKGDMKKRIAVVSKYDAFYTGGGVQMTQDGQFMLCCYGDSIKVVDISSGKIEATFGGKENDELTSFVLAYDDRTLVTAAKNGILDHWDFKEKTKIKTWKSVHIGPIACMTFDSTSTLLATGGSDSTIKVWDIVKKYYTHNFRSAQGVFSIVCFYQNDSDLIVFGAADDYKIRGWSLNSRQCIATLEGHYSTVTGLQFCKKQNIIISGGRDKVVLLWNLHDFTLIKTIPVYESIEAVILVPEGRTLPALHIEDETFAFITAVSRGILKVWDGTTGRCIHSQEDVMSSVSQEEGNEQSIATQAFFNKALDVISIVTFEHNIVIYKLEDFSLVKQFVGYIDEVLDIKFMGKEETHLAVATNSPLIKIYEISTYACQLLDGHKDIVVSLDVFPKDRNMLISGSKDNTVLVWQMDSGTGRVSYLCMGYGHTHNVSSVACCRSKSKFFVSASDDTTLKVWDVPAKKPLVALKFRLSPRCTAEAHNRTINSISISINDKLVATGSQDHTAKIWNASDLSLAGTMKGHRKGVMCVAFSPVDLVLATASKDGTVKLWSLEDCSVLKNFEDHYCAVQNVLFLSEGTQLLSSSCDGVMKLWNIRKIDCVQTESQHNGEIWALAASCKEDTIVSGGADSSIILWKDVTEETCAEEFEKRKNFVLHEQQLLNLMHEKKWVEALGLAVTLEQPARALQIVKEILWEENGSNKLHDAITKLQSDQIENLLRYTMEWITTPKLRTPSNLIIKSVLEIKSPEEWESMKDWKTIVRSLLPYAERSYEHIIKLYRETAIIDFLWRNAHGVTEEHNEPNDTES